MDLVILNTSLDPVSIVDLHDSFIWTDRYQGYGDFELYTSMRSELLDSFRQDYYLTNNDSEHVMIIEKLSITSDVEDGNHIKITGRSLESILNRRVVWGQKTLDGNLQTAIHTLLNENIISPSNSDRQISNFIFETSVDEAITGLTIQAQYTGDNLYDIILSICKQCDIGFKITLNDSKQFVFKLYSGVDRSYDQLNNSYVIFAPSFENIINSNYIESKSALKNVALIGGEGEGYARVFSSVGSVTGLDRRELFADARDISSSLEDGTTMTRFSYDFLLQKRGNEKLAECKVTKSFEGAVETTVMFKYGIDFFNGDIVQIANEYGHEAKARIIEIVMSNDEGGSSVYPTFETVS